MNKETALIVIFAIVGIASGVDLVADVSHGASMEHVVKEAAIVGLSAIAIGWLLHGLRQQRVEIAALRQELDSVNASDDEVGEYVRQGRETLGQVVSQQFSEWSLTGSEVDVGWMLLKGLSLKEIALLRETQEKTVRQQASSIYAKANVSGRHAFSAWFIEDIL